MFRQYLVMFLLVSAGAIGGVLLTVTNSPEPERLPSPESSSTTAGAVPVVEDPRVALLQAEVTGLKQRLASLEASLQAASTGSPPEAGSPPGSIEVSAPLFETSSGPVSVADALVVAGLDAYQAEDITRRHNEFELRRLELRDQAIRDGTIGTDEYRQQLAALRQEEIDLRQEVAPDVYDRYLYHTGQTNRVSVQSVILGSTAEEAGLQAGDMLLSYDNNTIYNFRDLRAATLDGDRDETVNVRVLRDSIEMTVSVSRGPLGVRLDALRVPPSEG